MQPLQRRLGFTLAELLIALTILGVVATFTIPKILSSQQNDKKKAVFRETIAMFSELVYTGQLTGDLSGQNFDTYIFPRVNAVRLCTSDAVTENCWTHAVPGGSNADEGLILPNGATVAGIGDGSGSGPYRQLFYIDWNGDQLPNTDGDDQLRVRACWGVGTCSTSQRPGTIIAEPGQASSMALFAEIFQ